MKIIVINSSQFQLFHFGNERKLIAAFDPPNALTAGVDFFDALFLLDFVRLDLLFFTDFVGSSPFFFLLFLHLQQQQYNNRVYGLPNSPVLIFIVAPNVPVLFLVVNKTYSLFLSITVNEVKKPLLSQRDQAIYQRLRLMYPMNRCYPPNSLLLLFVK
ncbi:hypothetical protein BLOT_015013 [Blomia tropicalis]|nr:hypothetical protein BLOT_015013 [Blomia tropicalis]